MSPKGEIKQGSEITLRIQQENNLTIVELDQKELNKIDFELCHGPANIGGRQTLEQYYASCDVKPDFLINGGFFNMANGETIWAYEDDKKPIMDYGVQYHIGIGIVDGKLTYGNWYDYDWTDFVTGYPILIENGKKTSGTIGWNDSGVKGTKIRTSLGWNDDKVYIICAEGNGVTLSYLQDLFFKLNCKYASNLDGGGSTRMLKNGKKIVGSIANRPVDNVVAFYIKPIEEEKQQTLYRVQVGAYGVKANAEAMKQKVREVPGCENAYVRLIGNLYKVQCGAFSVKSNAEKLRNVLKEHGFSAFITT